MDDNSIGNPGPSDFCGILRNFSRGRIHVFQEVVVSYLIYMMSFNTFIMVFILLGIMVLQI